MRCLSLGVCTPFWIFSKSTAVNGFDLSLPDTVQSGLGVSSCVRGGWNTYPEIFSKSPTINGFDKVFTRSRLLWTRYFFPTFREVKHYLLSVLVSHSNRDHWHRMRCIINSGRLPQWIIYIFCETEVLELLRRVSTYASETYQIGQ